MVRASQPKRGNSPSGVRKADLRLLEHLRNVDIFKDLSPGDVENLFRRVEVRESTPGTLIFTPDDPTERLFVLKEGLVELYRLTPGGKRLVMRRVGPNTIFGEMGLLGQTMQCCFAEATENALVCVATRADVLRLLSEHPAVAMRLLEAVGSRLRLLEERLEEAAFSPVKVRLANFLLANMDRSSGEVVGYSHAEIGDIIGALRQTVTETLAEMQSQGLVVVGHKRIRVVDHDGLEQIGLGET